MGRSSCGSNKDRRQVGAIPSPGFRIGPARGLARCGAPPVRAVRPPARPRNAPVQARPGPGGGASAASLPRRPGLVEVPRGGRGSRPGDVRPRPRAAALPAPRGRVRLPAAGHAQHAGEPAAGGEPPPAAAPLVDDLSVGGRSRDDPAEAVQNRQVYAAIRELPEEFRDALVAVDVAGLSYGEAARMLGVPEGTLTSRLFRARDRVAARLGGEPGPATGQ